ncbi:glycosyl hydrolase family 28-related protein [Pontiella sulfatireligans]|uniref:Rhamnogalacturonase A/B/Epimerase-like pectate lyase domain-containing protein n=1 Tax=Pontiella sulfatireligans TaxID=2750658 RepID=A0A6C2UG13_9BACT|nr:glycosyl hydrolase family 28-related protein [Pontiella sulfatireligans]VGO19110.1 hypothetical protein SCARR_01166 [Pontiella sulfatireligans]
MRKQFVTAVVLITGLIGGLSIGSTVCAQTYSELWGKAGETWSPAGRLPDFSYAGYHCGGAPIPRVPQVSNVKSFGAKGDGVHDDLQAFMDAISANKNGAIYVPPGRYKITNILNIQKSNVVLRGGGPEKSILFFPVPLNEINPVWFTTPKGKKISRYSWSGGLLQINGDFQTVKLAEVTARAKRGDKTLTVSSTMGLKVGQRVEVFVQDDAQKTLTSHLYSEDSGDLQNFKGSTGSFVVTLTALTSNQIVFDRPLRFDIKLGWKPQIRSFNPTVSEVGIEDLGVEFPRGQYDGHFTEHGYNAISMSAVADCWVRNVRIINADSGIFIGAKFCTITDVTFESERESKNGILGHHGILLGGTDNLFTAFNFNMRFVHDLGVSVNFAGSVFSNGRGEDLNFDHHKRAPYENLFTHIDVGQGTRMWHCGGGGLLGKQCGARETFWNIRAEQPQCYPDSQFGPSSMNLVAIKTEQPSVKKRDGKWFEAIDPLKLEPQNLHEAQLARRLAVEGLLQ